MGETPVLWDSLCHEEHPTEAHDRSGAIWTGPSVRSDIKTPDVRVKSYCLLPESSLMNPFEPVELSLFSNKSNRVKNMEQPPSLLPAPTLGSHPADNEPNHNHSVGWQFHERTPNERNMGVFTLHISKGHLYASRECH